MKVRTVQFAIAAIAAVVTCVAVFISAAHSVDNPHDPASQRLNSDELAQAAAVVEASETQSLIVESNDPILNALNREIGRQLTAVGGGHRINVATYDGTDCIPGELLLPGLPVEIYTATDPFGLERIALVKSIECLHLDDAAVAMRTDPFEDITGPATPLVQALGFLVMGALVGLAVYGITTLPFYLRERKAKAAGQTVEPPRTFFVDVD